LRRLAREIAQNGRKVDAPIRPKGFADERRKAALGRVAHHADGGEGQAARCRKSRRHMRFHIDGCGSGGGSERALV